jgi:hypothetical protein
METPTLSECEVRDTVRAALAKHRVGTVARLLGLSYPTVCQLAVPGPCRSQRGTIAQARENLHLLATLTA